MNTTELEIFQDILFERKTVSQISENIGKSMPWISLNIDRLKQKKLIDVEKKGITHYISINPYSAGNDLRLLMVENAHMNFEKILTNSRLIILPLILIPGSTIKEIVDGTGLTRRTVSDIIKQWSGMGIIEIDKNTNKITLNRRQNNLIQFVKAYSEFRNRRLLEQFLPNAVIVWQWRNEFVFSIKEKIENNGFQPAALTWLDDIPDNDIIHVSEYYYYNSADIVVSKEEAFIQALIIDRGNPRILNLLKNEVNRNNIDIDRIYRYAKKYRNTTLIKKWMSKLA